MMFHLKLLQVLKFLISLQFQFYVSKIWNSAAFLKELFLINLNSPLISYSCINSKNIKICWIWEFHARLITYFGDFIFRFFVTLVAWFSVRCSLFARQDGQNRQTKWKINKLLYKIFVAKRQKQPKTKWPKWDDNNISVKKPVKFIDESFSF